MALVAVECVMCLHVKWHFIGDVGLNSRSAGLQTPAAGTAERTVTKVVNYAVALQV